MEKLIKKVKPNADRIYPSSSSEETFQIGKDIASFLQKNDILLFFGDLGAGKTTMIKGIVATICNIDPDCVNSPTFQYLNIYSGIGTVHHFDLYRLKGVHDFLEMGFDEVFSQDTITCIEWAERIVDILPDDTVHQIHIAHTEMERRLITYIGKQSNG